MRKLRDELELPGHVVMLTAVSRGQAIQEMRDIMADWERQGFRKPDDAPEDDRKQRFRELGRALGMKVLF